MLAHRRADVADLNFRARELRKAQGHLGPDEVAGHADRTFAVGDHVVVIRNDHHAGYLNGQRGTVTHVDTTDGTLRVDLGNDRTVQLGQAHLQRGDLDYGYAITAHRAQGATVDRTFVLGSEDLYREWGYTALSRHREEARFYIAQGDLDPEPDLDPEIDVLAYRLERILGKSAAERTANEQLQELTTDQLAAERERLADALKTDELPDAFAQRHLESAHKSAVKREQDVLGRIGLLNDRLDQTPWYKRKEFKSYLELREEATKQLAAAEIERRVAELDHLENIKATKEWLKKFGELAEEYLEVSRLHGDRLQLDQHVQHRIEKLELPATRLEAKHAVEPPKAVVRELDLNGPDLSDGPDLGM